MSRCFLGVLAIADCEMPKGDPEKKNDELKRKLTAIHPIQPND
jgi:hypothetical protein